MSRTVIVIPLFERSQVVAINGMEILDSTFTGAQLDITNVYISKR